ncbi:alpha/beta hydrolase [Frigidibacter sp. RF13]|uniref:alpha/beta fold hydrolase n=1 Tax=Frigidibacter sp. RF13 TaxID=2997340 RepID=UPI00226DD139|nr:alpha/beta hydrolase [Frigidibacter sp. RF13]MCY1125785.1 alpha/beta hydrolase [Frigidibacter sp. RF13]
MSGEAPFHADVAEAPGGVLCRWLTAADGVRIRAAFWRAGEKGTVLLFPGRTEYIEKYGPAAGEFRRRGFAMATIDWRGQGLADRPLPDRMTGHVGRFRDYQLDVAALLAEARAERLPEPYFLVAHSMGGAIGLRALHENLPVRAAAFSAPMWGIRIHPGLRPAAWALSTLSRPAGFGHSYAPGTSPVTYVAEAPYEDNVLTTDPEMYAFMQRQIGAHPDLALGGPSLHWLNEALHECLALRRLPAPTYPCLTALGTRERVVDTGPVHRVMAKWLGGKLDMIEGAEHEVMMERPAIRAHFYDAAAALFERNR